MSALYDIHVKTIDGAETSMKTFSGKVLLIVNVASQCGFTPQYEGLEALYQKYHPRGFEVLGFPCNQFGNQEPGNEAEIRTFCQTHYQVSFPLFAKIQVNGPETHPLYQLLKSEGKGLLGTEAIKWNFTKFLVDRDGKVIKRFAPQVDPISLSKEIDRII